MKYLVDVPFTQAEFNGNSVEQRKALVAAFRAAPTMSKVKMTTGRRGPVRFAAEDGRRVLPAALWAKERRHIDKQPKDNII